MNAKLISNAIRTLAVLALLLGSALTGKAHAVQAAAAVCGQNVFCASEEAAQLTPLDPQLLTLKVTHAYTGPGYAYLNYGDLAEGYLSPVIGVSADGLWWVIPLPASIAADRMGWVRAEDVSAKNVQVLSDWLAHCDPNTYCGYIRSRGASTEQVLPDWLAHCDPVTYCGYILSRSPRYTPVKTPSPLAPQYGLARQ
jgi:hypothetical protein